MITKIITEDDYKATDNALQAIIKKGASLGGVDFLPDSDKMEFTRLGYMIKEWEDIHYLSYSYYCQPFSEENRRAHECP